MLIQFFRKDYILQYVALLFLQLFFWAPAIVFPEQNYLQYQSFTSPGFNLFLFLAGNSPRLYTVMAFVIVFFTAITLNTALDKHQLVTKNNLVTAFIYIILMSHRPTLLSLYPTLIASLFIVIAIYQIFNLYMEKEAYSKIFNISILLAIGSLFYFEIIVLLIFLWLTFNIYRIYFWREWVIPILGFLTVYLFLAVYYFWTDQLGPAIEHYHSHLKAFYYFKFNFTLNYFSITVNAAVYLLALASLINLVARLNEYTISVRKHYLSSVILLFITFLIILLVGSADSTNISLLLIPMSIIISGYLMRLRKAFWVDVYIWLLLTLILFHNYYAIISPQIFD